MQQLSEKRQFQIQSCLGRGGFGEVYRAVMISAGGLRSDVAVKVLHQDLDPRSQAVERLRDEARLLGILNHPSILRVTDLVLLEERVALVTEYIEGADLDQCISSDDPIPMRAAVECMARVCDALHAAHTSPGADGQPLQLVHRDIKPQNIRISKHGTVKLLDFGIAKAADSRREAKTQTNAIIGSFLYMAPERFDKDGDAPPADVYALGATLFEAITGQQLYADLTVKQQYFLAFDQTKHDEALDQRFAELDDVPQVVLELLQRMLSYEAAHRPTPHELSGICDDLAEGLDGPSLRKWSRSHPWPNPDQMTGPLDGKVITETSFTISRTREHHFATPAPAPSRPQAAAASAPAAPAQTQSTSAQPAPSLVPDEGAKKAGLVAIGGVVGVLGLLGFALIVGAIGWFTVGPGAAAPVAEVQTVATKDDRAEEEPDTATPRPAPAPAPAPVAPKPAPVAVAPAPAPAPVVTPKPRPSPRPSVTKPRTPTPRPAATGTATARVTGANSAEFRNGSGAHSPGSLAPGTYELWADVGNGLARQTVVTLSAGQSVSFKCSKLRRTCTKAN